MGQVQTIIHELGNGLAIERVQDVEPILDHAHNLRVAGHTGSSEMRHAASIPMVAVESYMNQTGITMHEFMADKKHIKAMLNDPALRAFRVWEGRV